MKICVLGTGYVGLVSAVCFAELGHQVIGVDIEDDKIKKLRQGISPIYEPGINKLLKDNLKKGNLFFTKDISFALRDTLIVLNAVGTPSDEQRRVDLRYVRSLAEEVGKKLDHYIVFVNKSTVPVGTADEVRKIIQQKLDSKIDFDVASNPEFLREGSAIEDFMNPDRIIVGVNSSRAGDFLQELYKPIVQRGTPLMLTGIESAELIKYASNSFLATKIAFINEIANLCDIIDADVVEVTRGMGLDHRIGSDFLEPGPGFGGSCLPKDIDELRQFSSDMGIEMRVLEATIKANQFQQSVVIQKLYSHLPDLVNKVIAVWGLAFKPETDDARESSALSVIKKLVQKGAKIKCYDPVAGENAKKLLDNSDLIFVSNKMDALSGADALILMTHWAEFKRVKPQEIKKHLEIVIDTRNIWDRKQFEKAGLIYEGMGR